MLSRLSRSLAGFTRSKNTEAKGTPSVNLDITLLIMNDQSNFCALKASKIIRGFYFLGKSAEASEKNWAEDSLVISSLEKLLPIIKDISSEDLNTLIRNLSLLKVKDNKVWAEIEKVFIERSHKVIQPKELFFFISNFNQAERKSSGLWELLESKLLNEVYPKLSYTVKQTSNIFRAFAENQYGSEKLFETLKNSFIEKIDAADVGDLYRILVVSKKTKAVDRKFFELLLSKLLPNLGQLNENQLFYLVQAFADTDLKSDLLILLENALINALSSLRLDRICSLTYIYGMRFSSKSENFEDRKRFMTNLGTFYFNNKSSLHNSFVITSDKMYFEVKIYWGLTKFDYPFPAEAWREFTADLSKFDRSSATDAIKQVIAEVEEQIKQKEFTS